MKAPRTSVKGNHLPKVQIDAANQRRRQILAWIGTHDEPIRGAELAKHFRVSRQCLVQDMAILRAAGEEILATPQGYRSLREKTGARHAHRAVLASRHPPERTEEELQILVDHGVRVLDVIVEHPDFGVWRGS